MQPEQLISAIRAALDDLERLALAAAPDASRRRWMREAISCVVDATDNGLIVYGEGTPTPEQAEHIAHNDPAAVLRRVAADREMLREAEALYDLAAKDPTYTAFRGAATAYDIVLRALARGLGINPEEETP